MELPEEKKTDEYSFSLRLLSESQCVWFSIKKLFGYLLRKFLMAENGIEFCKLKRLKVLRDKILTILLSGQFFCSFSVLIEVTCWSDRQISLLR